jgi:hypothetical protein
LMLADIAPAVHDPENLRCDVTFPLNFTLAETLRMVILALNKPADVSRETIRITGAVPIKAMLAVPAYVPLMLGILTMCAVIVDAVSAGASATAVLVGPALSICRDSSICITGCHGSHSVLVNLRDIQAKNMACLRSGEMHFRPHGRRYS